MLQRLQEINFIYDLKFPLNMEPRISYDYNKFEKIMMNNLEKHAPNIKK